MRCVPPGNLPTTAEINACNPFLADEFAAMPNLRAVLALGLVAHKAVLRSKRLKLSHAVFRHGAMHELPDGLLLANSYHVSRLNTNTGRLTEAMFEQVVSQNQQTAIITNSAPRSTDRHCCDSRALPKIPCGR